MKTPHWSLLLSALALVLALGGTSYASVTLAKNSVGSAQLQKNSVGAGALKGGSVTSRKVRNGSLLAADFATGQLPSVKGVKGDKGDKGDRGPAGPTGPQGPAVARFSASVSASGALTRGSGVTGLVRAGAGSYDLSFARSVAACVVLATIGQDDQPPAPGTVATSITGSDVHVATTGANGTAADRPFYLGVIC